MEGFRPPSRFVIQRQIGSGSFGVVYEAYDRQRDSLVALKTLCRADAKSLYRFKREFRTLAGLTHRNLVTLYELMSQNGQWFFTMELIHGVNFLDYVMRNRADTEHRSYSAATLTLLGQPETAIAELSGGDLPPPAEPSESRVHVDRLRIALKQLAEGVYFLHQRGVLHRDLKPSNVLVTRE